MFLLLISILLVFTVFYKIQPIIFCVLHKIVRIHKFLQEFSVNEKAAIRDYCLMTALSITAI